MDRIKVEVAYGTRECQEVIEICVPRGTTALEAVKVSGIARLFPEIDPDTAALGIFGRHESPARILESHDRVEVYRPLLMDPREARRRRASGR